MSVEEPEARDEVERGRRDCRGIFAIREMYCCSCGLSETLFWFRCVLLLSRRDASDSFRFANDATVNDQVTVALLLRLLAAFARSSPERNAYRTVAGRKWKHKTHAFCFEWFVCFCRIFQFSTAPPTDAASGFISSRVFDTSIN